MKTLLQTIIDDQHTHWEASTGHKFELESPTKEKRQFWKLDEALQSMDTITLTFEREGKFRFVLITYKGGYK